MELQLSKLQKQSKFKASAACEFYKVEFLRICSYKLLAGVDADNVPTPCIPEKFSECY